MNVTETLIAILDEAFDRPPTSWSHFTDGDGQSGYFGTLDNIDFQDARRSVVGNSIAAQTQHVSFVIRVANDLLSGAAGAPDAERWRQSWSINDINPEIWDRMRDEVRTGYGDLRRSIRNTPIDDDETLTNIVGVVAHVAYHLGAIRCKAQAIKPTQHEDAG